MIKTIRILLVLVAVLALVHCTAQNKSAKVNSIVKEIYEENPDLGISVGLIYNDEKHFFNYGSINREKERQVDNQSVFEIGSVSKLLTSYLIAQQVEKGNIQLNDYIDDYLSGYFRMNPAIQRQIKISDLASHQSGLPDFDLSRLLNVNPHNPFDEVTEQMVDSILFTTTDLSKLGSYEYSNVSYVLLGYILESVCDDKYEQILKKYILDPLRMDGTLTSEVIQTDNITTGYSSLNEPQVMFNWNGTFAPAGLVKSTSLDMVKFLEELLASTNNDLMDELETPYFKNTHVELGLGLNILREEGNVIYAKSGDSLGQSCVLGYNPDKNWGVIILTNQASGIARQIFGDIIPILNE